MILPLPAPCFRSRLLDAGAGEAWLKPASSALGVAVDATGVVFLAISIAN
ncbi:MAG: hypothetical protein AABZ67_02815 [Pseudomonadota bacterium]